MSIEKFPLFSPERSFNLALAEPKHVSLKEKARIFLIVIDKIRAIFFVHGLLASEEKHSFVQKATAYKRRCRDLIEESSFVAKFGDREGAIRKRQDNAAENEGLDEAIERFDYEVRVFLENVPDDIQEKVLRDLECLDTEEETNQFLQEIVRQNTEEETNQILQEIVRQILQEIVRQIKGREKLNYLDKVLNTKIDELSNIYFIALTIYRGDKPFSFMDKQAFTDSSIISPFRKRINRLRYRARRLSATMTNSGPKFEAISSSKMKDAVYDAIKIDESLFEGNKGYEALETMQQIAELDKIENSFLELQDLSRDLLFIFEKEKAFSLTAAQKDLIGKLFPLDLGLFLAEQHKLRKKTKQYCVEACRKIYKILQEVDVSSYEEAHVQEIKAFIASYDFIVGYEKESCVHNLMYKKDMPDFSDKKKGFYLYRTGSPEEIHILVIHDSNTREILNLTRLAKKEKQCQEILKEIKWPEDKDIEVELDGNLVKFITSHCEHPKEYFQLLKEHAGLFKRMKFLIEDSCENSNGIIDCFLNIYDEISLHKQNESSALLLYYFEKIEALLKSHPEQCERYNENIERIRSFGVRWVQQCTRRKLHVEKILSELIFDDSNRKKAIECYKEISYIPTRENTVSACKEDGYIRPKELFTLLEADLNKNKYYSVAYFLMNTGCEESLKNSFLSFASTQKGSKQKLDFFRKMFNMLRMQPLCLEDLKEVYEYFKDDDNPLGLDPLVLQAIQTAFKADKQTPAIQVQQIVSALIPAVESVSLSLQKILKSFQQSHNIIDDLWDVPEIREKLNENQSLWALDQEAIRTLPQFWKEVFTDEKGALRRFLTQKKNELVLYQDIPPIITTALTDLLDVEMTEVQFLSRRNLITKILLEKEIDRQIEAFEGIFHDNLLKILRENKKQISTHLSKKAFSTTDRFFIPVYVTTLLEVPYHLLEVLAQTLLDREMKIGAILSDNFLQFLGADQIFLTGGILSGFLSNEAQQYYIQNRGPLQEIEQATSVFRLFNMINSRPTFNAYDQLGEKIRQLNSKSKSSSSSKESVHVKKKRSFDDRPESATPGGVNGIFTPPANTTVASCAPSIPFETFVENVEQKVADNNEQWRMEKCIKSRNEVTAEDDLIPDALTADCNFIAVYDKKDDGLIFTAEKKEGNPTARHSTSLPTKESCIVKNYRHGHDEVTMVVSAMAESVPSLESAPPGARRILKINLTALPEDELALIAEYVGVALAQEFFPKITLNDGVPLTHQALYDKLKQQDPSLADTYNKELKQQRKIYLGLKKQGFFPGAPGELSLGTKPVGKKQGLASSVSRVLSFKDGP